jgi:uncharacterized protein (DUF58 family)
MESQQGVYVSFEELMSLQERSRHIATSLSAVTKNMLQGNRPSKVNGRGGAFDKIRLYMAGDDVRNIDWNVTARLRKPYVRVFNEERETPLLLLVDQSSDMFFATRRQMKSVVAAKIAAYLLWMAHTGKRPCGGIIYGDDDHRVFRPHANTSSLYQLIEQVVQFNHKLSKQSQVSDRSFSLADGLRHLNHIVPKEAVVILISDFMQVDEACWQLIQRLSLRANVIATPICDGVIDDIPQEGHFLARYTNLEAELDFSSPASRQTISRQSQARVKQVTKQLGENGIPAHVFSTYKDVEEQLLSGLYISGGSDD